MASATRVLYIATLMCCKGRGGKWRTGSDTIYHLRICRRLADVETPIENHIIYTLYKLTPNRGKTLNGGRRKRRQVGGADRGSSGLDLSPLRKGGFPTGVRHRLMTRHGSVRERKRERSDSNNTKYARHTCIHTRSPPRGAPIPADRRGIGQATRGEWTSDNKAADEAAAATPSRVPPPYIHSTRSTYCVRVDRGKGVEARWTNYRTLSDRRPERADMIVWGCRCRRRRREGR